MSREFPDWINPWAAAQARREFRGTLPLARMRRLAPLLADDGGEAGFECRLALDNERRPLIHLHVVALLPLQCQASLRVYHETIERRSELGVVAEESEEQLLPSHLEPVWAPTGRLALIDLVEDELLLALPRVPRDPDFQPRVREFGGSGVEAVPPDAPREEKRQSFADLARMLGRSED